MRRQRHAGHTRFPEDVQALIKTCASDGGMARVPQPRLRHPQSQAENPVIFDGRNLYNPALVRGMGFDYSAIGR
jgi:hypothetical protein